MKFTREQIAKALKLYVITDRGWLKEDETLLSVCEKVIQNGATFLQLREKELGAEETRKEAIELQKLCHRYNIPFVVNDSVEIALEMDADGVHVGQSDIKERDIRAMIGPDKILGMTAKTVEQAIAAEKAGADYIGTGAVFGSTTKSQRRSGDLRDLCRRRSGSKNSTNEQADRYILLKITQMYCNLSKNMILYRKLNKEDNRCRGHCS